MSARARRIAGCAMLALALAGGGRAHDAFSEYVWHRAEIGARDGRIAVTLQLTFFEDWSERERRRMDADGDGRIQLAEREAYVRSLASTMTAQLALTIGGRRAALIPLYEPEIDLLATDAVARSHHQLTLRFIARPPAVMSAGDEIVLEDRLWPEARGLGELAAAGGLLAGGDAAELGAAGLRFSARFTTPAMAPESKR